MRHVILSYEITDRTEVTDYLFKDIVANTKQLSNEETIKLIGEGRYNDAASGNLRFAISVAKRYQGCGLSLDDVISEAFIGLLNATRKFDVTMSNTFASFAVGEIIGAITHALQSDGKLVRIPHYLQVRKQNVTSLDAPCNDEDGESWYNFFPSDVVTDCHTDKESDAHMVDTLINMYIKSIGVEKGKKRGTILRKYYGIGYDREYSQYELAKEFGCTEERIRQIVQEAVQYMQKVVEK